jgi:hypothetical protein
MGLQAFPKDVDILELGADTPFVCLHINALQGGPLRINFGLDDGGARRRVGIIDGRGFDAPLFEGPLVFEGPEAKRHPIIDHLLVRRPIGDVLQFCQLFGFLGAFCQQFPEGFDRLFGNEATVVIHVQSVVDFIGIFTALNRKKRDVFAPCRQREEKKDQ